MRNITMLNYYNTIKSFIFIIIIGNLFFINCRQENNNSSDAGVDNFLDINTDLFVIDTDDSDNQNDSIDTVSSDIEPDIENTEDVFLKGIAIASFQADNGPGVVDENSDWYKWVTNPVENFVNGDLPSKAPGLWNKQNLINALDFINNSCINSYRFNFEWSRFFPFSTTDLQVNYEEENGFITKVDVPLSVLMQMDSRVNTEALEYYEDLLLLLKERNIEPVATINHFTLPQWLHNPHEVYFKLRNDVGSIDVEEDIERGGLLNKKTVIEFAKFASYIAWKFGDKIKYWFTLNEPTTTMTGYLRPLPEQLNEIPYIPQESFPPGVFLSWNNFQILIKNMISFHVVGYDAVKNYAQENTKVGIVVNTIHFVPNDERSQADIISAGNADYLYNQFLINAVTKGWFDLNMDKVVDEGELYEFSNKLDLIGINYYLRQWVQNSDIAEGIFWAKGYPTNIFNFLPQINKCEYCSDFSWDIYPEGLRYRIEDYWELFQLPIMITENGIADDNDDDREQYIRNHLQIVEEMRNNNIPILGYMYWSLIDNFEWSYGFSKKFGLLTYTIDEQQKVIMNVRPSYYYYTCHN